MFKLTLPTQGNFKTAIFKGLALFLAVGFVTSSSTVIADEKAPDKKTAQFEIRFMTNMIDHHHMAVMMAELCEGRALHEDLLDLCEEIQTSQMQEMSMMQSWLEEWYNRSYEPKMKPRDRRMIEHLASHRGSEFEIEFMQMMIRHHRQAIEEAETCERRAYHEPLQELCHEMTHAQSAEIDLMQDWLCEWYEICPHGTKGHKKR